MDGVRAMWTMLAGLLVVITPLAAAAQADGVPELPEAQESPWPSPLGDYPLPRGPDERLFEPERYLEIRKTIELDSLIQLRTDFEREMFRTIW